jgi:hypothetical protein
MIIRRPSRSKWQLAKLNALEGAGGRAAIDGRVRMAQKIFRLSEGAQQPLREPSSRTPWARARCLGPIRALVWREWADQRPSRGEGPCVSLLRVSFLRVYWLAVVQ